MGLCAASVARTVVTASNSTTRAWFGVSRGRSGIQALAGRPGASSGNSWPRCPTNLPADCTRLAGSCPRSAARSTWTQGQ